MSDFFQYKDEEDYINQQLAPLGVSLDTVRKQGYVDLPHSNPDIYKWTTSSGKIELSSAALDKAGLDLFPWPELPPEVRPSAPPHYLDILCVRFLW